MVARSRLDPALIEAVRGLTIDQTYLRDVISELTAIGSSQHGFRTTGTPEDAQVAAVVARRMRAIGLLDVAIEEVTVDAWRFEAASVTLAGAAGQGEVDDAAGDLSVSAVSTVGDLTVSAVSFGGVPATPEGGISGVLRDVADGRRTVLDAQDLTGAIALVDWRKAEISPAAVVLELAARGCVGMVLNCPTGGPWYQSDGALGAFDGDWPEGGIPMILISGRDAREIRRRLAVQTVTATMTLVACLNRDAVGYNVVGYLPASGPERDGGGDTDVAGPIAGLVNGPVVGPIAGLVNGPVGPIGGLVNGPDVGPIAGLVNGPVGPIVVGAHHDAWFSGAFDNTSGVAALLAIAKGLVQRGYRPKHRICFTSRTAEEYGIAASSYDWCVGAFQQVETTHPDWAESAPFHLCLEASGHRRLRAVVEAPVELAGWARAVCRAAQAQGWTPTGWRVAPPVSGTEQWPLLVSGIPGVASYSWEKSFGQTDYHTQFDTIDLLDFDVLESQCRLHALLLVSADQDPEAILDHRARARELTRMADRAGSAVLAAAGEHHLQAAGRPAFTRVGRQLLALNAHGAVGYPHEQALADLKALDEAIAALDRSDRRAAARALRKVGMHFLFDHLCEQTFTQHVARYLPPAVARSWASRCHLPDALILWRELASILGQSAAPDFGPWVTQSLVDCRQVVRKDLDDRLAAMAEKL